MKIVFQETHKDPKHLQLLKIYRRFLYFCHMFRQQYKIVVLKCCCSFISNSAKHFCIYCYLPLVCFCIKPFSTCRTGIKLSILCSGLYLCPCLLAIYITFPSLRYSALHYRFDSVIRFLALFQENIFCVAFFCQQPFRIFISVILINITY